MGFKLFFEQSCNLSFDKDRCYDSIKKMASHFGYDCPDYDTLMDHLSEKKSFYNKSKAYLIVRKGENLQLSFEFNGKEYGQKVFPIILKMPLAKISFSNQLGIS